MLGGLGAIAKAFAGYHMRKRLSRGMPDLKAAVLEDTLAIGGGVLITSLLGGTVRREKTRPIHSAKLR